MAEFLPMTDWKRSRNDGKSSYAPEKSRSVMRSNEVFGECSLFCSGPAGTLGVAGFNLFARPVVENADAGAHSVEGEFIYTQLPEVVHGTGDAAVDVVLTAQQGALIHVHDCGRSLRKHSRGCGCRYDPARRTKNVRERAVARDSAR
ncbi:uncharacterized protein LOC112459874 [Temnothorax curvispinosus]|uniref:Uncharacterized protein LOC112459874 n=1 Tax=Temnothorax curvispinosus TaxID=300111 RepID=A0A6J1QFI3_9HYME|nr:uncharacterized protein LOC112459874 [Temnothorax curvispinosus]